MAMANGAGRSIRFLTLLALMAGGCHRAVRPASPAGTPDRANAHQERSVFTDSLWHLQKCMPDSVHDWHRYCTPKDQSPAFIRPRPPR